MCYQTINGENCFFNYDDPEDYCDSCFNEHLERWNDQVEIKKALLRVQIIEIDVKIEVIAHLRHLKTKYEDNWQEEAFFSEHGSETSDRAKGLSELCNGYEIVLENEIRILNNLKARIRPYAIKAAMGKHADYDGFFLYWCNISTQWMKAEGNYFQESGLTRSFVYSKQIDVYGQES